MVAIRCEMSRLVVSHPPDHLQMTPETATPATSTREQEENEVITHLVVVELSRCARGYIELRCRENQVQGENNEQTLYLDAILVISAVSPGLGMFLLYIPLGVSTTLLTME